MTHDGSMVLLYMVTWIPSIYPLCVSIYTSTMDPMGDALLSLAMVSKGCVESCRHRGGIETIQKLLAVVGF